MGVKNLWSLMDNCGKPIRLESLEGKTLAIDASIWLHQFLNSMRDKKGHLIKGAHLVGFFQRICKLLFFNIKPVFIYDGSCPTLKKNTIQLRKQKRWESEKKGWATSQHILKKKLKLAALQAVTGRDDSDKTDQEKEERKREESEGSMERPKERLPERLPESLYDPRLISEEELLGFIESHVSQVDLRFANIESNAFKHLPTEVQYQVILDLKNQSRQPSQERLNDMLMHSKTPLDFSQAQIHHLVQRNYYTEKAMQVAQQTKLHPQVLEIKDPFHHIVNKRVAGERNTDFALLKDASTGGYTMQVHSSKKENLKKIDDMETEIISISSSSEDNDEQVVLIEKKSKSVPIVISDDEESLEESLEKSLEESVKDSIETKSSKKNLVSKWTSIMSPQVKRLLESYLPLMPEIVSDWDIPRLEKEIQFFTTRRGKCLYKSIKDMAFGIYIDFLKDVVEQTRLPTMDISKEKSKEKTNEEFSNESKEESKSLSFPPIQPSPIQSSPIQPVLPTRISDMDAVLEFEEEEEESFKGQDDRNVLIVDPNETIDVAKNPQEKSMRLSIGTMEEPWQRVSPLEPSVYDLNAPCDSKDDHPDRLSPMEDPSFPDPTAENPTGEHANTKHTNTEHTNTENLEISLQDRQDSRIDIPMDLEEENQEFERFLSQLSSTKEMLQTELDTLLIQERKEMRDASSLTESMILETQQLLKLFGIPFLTAPTEAEAQCAYLELQGHVDGVVTDDSDIFLFGASKVYRHFFNQQKFCEFFSRQDIAMKMGLDRLKMIQLAYLVGSDYTEGIDKIGPVNALEILREFESKDPQNPLKTLQDFKDWMCEIHDISCLNPIRKRLLKLGEKISIPDSFPDPRILEAYLSPVVECQPSHFTFSHPNLEGLRQFMQKVAGWTFSKTDRILIPVLKEIQDRRSSKQTKLHEFFSVSNASHTSHSIKKHKSKRVNQIISGWTGNKD